MVLLDNGGRRADEFTLIAPPPDLGPLVEHIWIQEGTPSSSDWRVVPDGSPHLIAIVTASGIASCVRVVLVGARSVAANIDVAHRRLTVGVRFKPGALAALTRISAREFLDRSVDADCVFGARDLQNLEISPDAPHSLILAELIRLTRRACHGRLPSALLPGSLSQLPAVADLAAWLHTPTRSLRERTHREVGLSPKRMLRVARLHAALGAARRPDGTLSDAAQAAGYADQAHFTRELHALLGETPSAWLARGSAVSFKTSRARPK